MQVVEKICADLDLELTPTNVSRGPMRLRCPKVLAGLIDDYGEGHVILTLRTIAESRGNESALHSQIIYAVSDLIRAHPTWAERGLSWVEAFDSIDLLGMARTAKVNRKAVPVRQAVAALTFDRLRQSLG
jgi:hypothetical protein